jgi:hypothetical protein
VAELHGQRLDVGGLLPLAEQLAHAPLRVQLLLRVRRRVRRRPCA